MKIKVEGKAHLQGTSKKTGKDYNFIQVHFLGKARGVEGLAAKTVNLDPLDYPFADVIVGGMYELEFDDRGYPVVFQPATSGSKSDKF